MEYIIECKGWPDYLNSKMNGKRLNTYEVQMVYLSYKYNMYSIYPNTNMVSNIGLDGGANNHVSKSDSMYQRLAERPKKELENICHPEELIAEKSYEKRFYKQRRLYGGSLIRIVLSCLQPDWLVKFRHQKKQLVFQYTL